MSKDVLLITPDVALKYAPNEVQAVINSGLRVHLLQGQVTLEQIIQTISRQKWSVIWIASHGAANGIQLSDGVLDVTLLTAYIRTAQAELVYLNTCESHGLAVALQRETQASLICTIGPIDDLAAYSTGALFAANLVKTRGNYRQAYELSTPGQNQVYLYLSGRKEAHIMETNDLGELQKEIRQLYQELIELRANVNAKMNVWESRFFMPLAEAARLPKDNPFHPVYFLIAGLGGFMLLALAIAAMLLYR